MKSTKLQKEIIDACISELYFWKNSNDINSPTHSCEIDRIVDELVIDDKITSTQASELSDSLHMLWGTIRHLNKQSK